MLAYDYPLLGVFWTLLWVFIWVVWIILFIRVVVDIFRSHDLGGFAKALWLLFIIVVPFLGVLVYVIARGHGMSQRDLDRATSQEQAFRQYVQQVAAPTGGGPADELTKLADLRDKGVITPAEFEAQKAKLLA